MNHNRELIWSLLTSLKWNQPHDRLYFTLLAELAHNLFSLLAQKLTFPPEDWLATESDWPLWARAFILHCYIIKKSYLSCKENFTCFDGSFLMVRTPWHIVCIKRREKKNRQSKRVSAFLLQLLIFLHRSLSFLSERQWNESLYFMSPVIVSNEFFTVETTKIGAMIFFSVFCSLYV